jgi:cell division protein FtsB
MRKYATTHESSRATGKSIGKSMMGSFLVLAIMFYLGFHAVSGERGVFALFKETRHLEEIQAKLTLLNAQHDALAHKVRLLSDGSLDLDLLDEQVRRVLGRANSHEVVYFTDQPPVSKK